MQCTANSSAAPDHLQPDNRAHPRRFLSHLRAQSGSHASRTAACHVCMRVSVQQAAAAARGKREHEREREPEEERVSVVWSS